MSNPDDFYTATQRKLQKENDSTNIANAAFGAIVRDELEQDHIEFISSRDYFFLSTVNSKGEPTVSFKGGPVGLVQIIDTHTLIFPNYDGNGMFYSMGNITDSLNIGMLFIDMVTPNRIRVQGRAKISKSAELLERFPGSNMVVEVSIDSVFHNCARYIHRHKRVETSEYIPDENGKQPFPAWKRIDKIQGALPQKDQGRAELEGGLITNEEYEERLKKGTS